MKLATFVRSTTGEAAVGVVDTARGTILDLAKASEKIHGRAEAAFGSMLALIEGGDDALGKARAVASQKLVEAEQPLPRTRLLSPLPIPQSIRDCLVFEQHLRNAMKAWEKLTGRPSVPISPTWYERPDLVQGQPLQRRRPRGRRAVAVLFRDDGLRAGAGLRHRQEGQGHDGREARSSTSSASPSSTTSPRATRRWWSARSAWGR